VLAPAVAESQPSAQPVARIWSALGQVEDPEFLVSIVDMGLVVGVERLGSRVDVKLTFTAMGCPATDMIIDDVRERLLAEPGIDEVTVEVVWHPVWTSDRLSPAGKLALHELGIAV